MANINMVQAIQQALGQALESDESVMLLGEDIGLNGGVFRATDGLQARFGERRVVDTPLAESAIVGAAVGLAVNGFKPVAELQFMGFLYPAMDQLCSQAARIRFRSAGRFSAPLVVRGPFGGGVRTPELHSESLEMLVAHTPGLKVVLPSNPYDAKGLLLSAIDDPDPVVFFEPMKLYRAFRQEVPEEAYRVPLGKAHVTREGSELTLMSWGPSVPLANQVADEMKANEGISLEVIDLRTLVPLDVECIIHSVQKSGRAVIVHEAVERGGFGAEVIAQINERALLSLEAPVGRVTGYNTPYPINQVEDEWLPTTRRVAQKVKETLNF